MQKKKRFVLVIITHPCRNIIDRNYSVVSKAQRTGGISLLVVWLGIAALVPFRADTRADKPEFEMLKNWPFVLACFLN